MFHLVFVHCAFLVRFGSLNGHLLEIAARSVGHLFSLSFVYL